MCLLTYDMFHHPVIPLAEDNWLVMQP
uniref:Uncharacterized protein n=1 Tax=Anguilla anguilla TaxID=7936 RepID=A0A0E9RBB8_ANGAN